MAGKKNYKTLLKECLALRASAGESAWERISRLVAVYADPDWIEEAQFVSPDSVAEILNQYVEDLCLTFLQLSVMYEQFPERSDWADGKLATLHQRALEKLSESRQETSDREPRRSATVADLKERDDKIEDLQGQVNYREGEINRLRQENGDLAGKIRELERENSTLEGRIVELERMSRLQPVA